MKFHDVAVLLLCVTLAVFVLSVGAQDQGAGNANGKVAKKMGGKGLTKTDPAAKSTAPPKSSGNMVQWSDLVKGGKLPYGNSVTLTGKLSDLTCGANSISDSLDISAISVSFLGQTSPAATAAISGTAPESVWTAPLGSLPADTAVNLQLKVTGEISADVQAEIVDELLADEYFQRSLNKFLDDANGKSSTVASQDIQIFLDNISSKSGPLTKILQDSLPSCVVATEVTSAAIKSWKANVSGLANVDRLLSDFKKLYDSGLKLDGYDPNMSAAKLNIFLEGGKFTANGKALSGDDPMIVGKAATSFTTGYKGIVEGFGDVIVELSQGVLLSQSSSTQDLSKYAGFDAGALYAPRISELRGFYMVHIYPTGPVELDTNGKIPFPDRWSIAVGESSGDISSNGASRVKNDSAFIYGLGFRINKYFRITAGGMVYRDAVGNRLLNEGFIGPSVDVTALPGLKSVFASSSSKATTAKPTTKNTNKTTQN